MSASPSRAPEAGREIAALGEAEDRAQAVLLAQPGVVAPVEELERLDEELHLANAAHAELDVAARAALGAKRLVDRILHLPHLADDRGVEARPEDEGADHLEEARGHRRIARTEARLDQRLALPELGPVREVGAIAVERQHERPHPALRPQSQIHAEGVALLGDRLERVRDEPHRLGEEVAVGDRPIWAARGVPVVAVDDDQVDVGGIVRARRRRACPCRTPRAPSASRPAPSARRGHPSAIPPPIARRPRDRRRPGATAPRWSR